MLKQLVRQRSPREGYGLAVVVVVNVGSGVARQSRRALGRGEGLEPCREIASLDGCAWDRLRFSARARHVLLEDVGRGLSLVDARKRGVDDYIDICIADQRAPHEVRPPGSRLLRGPLLPRRDDDPVLGSRHRDVQQTFVFPLLLLGEFLLQLGHDVRPLPFGQLEDGGVVGVPDDGGTQARFALTLGNEHDGRLESLGGMHGHDPDAAARQFHVALDLKALALDPVGEAFKRRDLATAEFKGLEQELLDGIRCIGPEPRQQGGARSLLAVEGE